MYHTISIPQVDQHVHRLQWRNLETHREPHIYVKTVLGDKSAPAMSQIALRKTADEEKESFPIAAQVIRSNSYIDDQCDSVRTQKRRKSLQKISIASSKMKTTKLPNAYPERGHETTPSPGHTEEKVLGVVWNSIKDTFTFRVQAVDLDQPIQISKRRILG